VTAAEFVRNAWRLGRFAMAEETLGEIVARYQASQNKTRNTDHPAADPMIYPAICPPRTPSTAPAPPPKAACAAPKPTSRQNAGAA
jgi:hypothetical protein